MHKPDYRHSGYLSNCIERDRLRKNIPQAVKILKAHKFDAIAFRGLSGTLVGPLLAYLLNKTVLAVRKPHELKRSNSHGYYQVEGDIAAGKYVIVDDFVSSGDTVREIIIEIHESAPRAICIGVLLIGGYAPRIAMKTVRNLVQETPGERSALEELISNPEYQDIIS